MASASKTQAPLAEFYAAEARCGMTKPHATSTQRWKPSHRRPHPLATLFPLLEGDFFDELVADIAANGLREPIVLFEGMILDGRNRYRACLAAGVEPHFVRFEGNDPLEFVISRNLHRRHLSEPQRAMVAARLATLRHGQRQTGKFAGVPTQAEAAALLNVSERSVRGAAVVRDHGAPELVQAVEAGALAISAAADVATLSKDEQRELLTYCDEREVVAAARAIRARETERRHAARIERLAGLAMSVPMPARRFPILLADPPWQFEVSAESGMWRCADMHYPCMDTADIAALDVPAAADAVLFLWATVPMLPHALTVMAAWQFEYRSHLVWVKNKPGTGYWVRNRHELLLIGVKGDMPAPLPGERPESVIEAPVRRHSEKPERAHEIIESMYPDLPKIELFARHRRAGWDSWGQ